MKRLLFLVVGVVLILFVIGIGADEAAVTSPPFYGGTFRSYLTSEPTNLDPARGVDVNSGNVQAKLFDGLVRYDESMRLVGNLAERWEVSPDGRRYTFHLRRGVVFHNGQALTAQDVLYSFDRLLDPTTASPRTWVLARVRGARERIDGTASNVVGLSAPDAYTVCIELNEPYAPFLSLLTMPAASILPSGSAAAIAQKGFFEKPVGTGPFRAVSRKRDSYIRLEANRAYHGPKKPQVGAIELRIIPEALKAEMEFESGNLDILQLTPANFNRFKARPEHIGRIHHVPVMNVFYIGLNNQKAPFNDVRVRRALNMLIDRRAILDSVFQGRGVLAAGSIPPGILGHSPDLRGFEFDPAEGKRLLAAAGFGPERPLAFDLFQRSSQPALEVTRLLQGELRRHGVQMTLRPMEWSALKDALNRGEAPAFYLSWFGDYPDGENFLFPLFHSSNWGPGGNRVRFKNPTVDAMLNDALRIQDPAKRGEAYAAINRLIVEEAPWIYLWHTPETYLLGPAVEEKVFWPLFAFDKGLTVRLARGL